MAITVEPVPPGAPEENEEEYGAYIDALVDFLKAKRDDLIRRGYTPDIDMLVAELEATRRSS